MREPQGACRTVSRRTIALVLLMIAFFPSAACAFFHLRAAVVLAADGVTWVHAVMAVLANWFGPWGVLAVRIVDFPNAGLRSFDLPLALGLTALLAGFLLFSLLSRRRVAQIALLVLFVPFAIIWFLVGFRQIGDGLF